MTRWDKENPEKMREYRARWRAKNPDYDKRRRIKELDKLRAYDKRRYSENPMKYRKYDLKKKFDLSLEEYDDMLLRQQGVCASCGNKETATRNGKTRNLCVDHCHSTGIIRGLLCSDCNIALGLLSDSPTKIENLLNYIRKF